MCLFTVGSVKLEQTCMSMFLSLARSWRTVMFQLSSFYSIMSKELVDLFLRVVEGAAYPGRSVGGFHRPGKISRCSGQGRLLPGAQKAM